VVLRSAFATLDDIRRIQMTAIHFEMPRGRLGRLAHYRPRQAAHNWPGRVLADRMLHDIGLTRADAEFLTNKPFWRD
jgi:Domain of unknown function (DUF1127)